MTCVDYRIIAGALLAAAAMMPATGQTYRGGNYPVQEMKFVLWCQEQAGLPAERCDKRTDADEAAFEAYRAKVESYEIPYLQQKSNAARLDTDILRNDPVDRPLTKEPPHNPTDSDTPSTAVPPRP